jgi:hypothetical protein
LRITAAAIWGSAVALYALFVGWYFNWRRPLSAAEVEDCLRRILAADPDLGVRNDPAILRRFLETDDGRQFFMLNVVKLAPGNVADPVTGESKPARAVMQGYTGMFLPALFRRGGHPAIVARKVGGYFDAWGVEPDPDWTIMGYVRYRSRRDLAELVSNPRFAGAHDFKFAAMPQTFSFPTQPMVLVLVSPAVTVGLVLALAAALLHLAVGG